MGEQDDVATLGAATGENDVATAGLRQHLWRALARPGVAGAAEEARAAAADAADLARGRLEQDDAEGALSVLETARGLALYAAIETRPVAAHLADAGKPHLARQWQAAAAVAEPHRLPADLRRDVLATLLAHSPAAVLLAPPAVAEIQAALGGTGADALVHLIPGHAVITPADGPVTHLPLPGLTTGAEHIERFLATLALHNAAASTTGPRPETDAPDPIDPPTVTPPPWSDLLRLGPDAVRPEIEPVGGWFDEDGPGFEAAEVFDAGPANPRRPEAVRPWFLTDQQGTDATRPWPVATGPRRETAAERAVPVPAPSAPISRTSPAGRPSIDLPSIDLPSIGLPSIDLPSIDPPSIDPPSIDPPSIDLTSSLQSLCRWSWDVVIGPLLEHLTATRVVDLGVAAEDDGAAHRFPGAPPVPIPALDPTGLGPTGLGPTGLGPTALGPTALGPTALGRRAPRIILVAAGELARVPWQAARRGDGTYALELLAISQAVSARMLCHNATLPPLPPSAAGLVVADPETAGQSRDLPAARLEAWAIQQSLYPQARFTGRRPDGTASPSGAGTLDQVRAWLTTSNPGAGSTLHLACAGFTRAGADRPAAYALMAGGERLTATEVVELAGRARCRPIDLVVLAGGRTGLSLSGYDEAFGLGTAFLAGDVRSVLATRWTVPDAAAPAVLFLAHLHRRAGKPVWEALRAAQLWMLDPARVIPSEMPAELAAVVRDADASAAIAWAAVTHWGR